MKISAVKFISHSIVYLLHFLAYRNYAPYYAFNSDRVSGFTVE
ncbi:MAG: hypothetical protein ACKPB9_34390 [Dolichospermum sp.]